MPQAALSNRAPLAANPFTPLPAGSIRPSGWLARQLRIQADGLGGRLDETWGDVGQNSGWLGGSGEKWERGPYFLDGLLPLAWALDDPKLKAKAQAFIEWTLSSARPDGMFGPAGNDDWWPRMVMLKALAQYHELTGDPRVIVLMRAYFRHQRATLRDRPLRDWGRFRWQDQALVVLWLYNRTGEAALLDLAKLLKAQGWDWRGHFATFPFTGKVTAEDLAFDEKSGGEQANALKDRALSGHGVNTAMGVKAGAIWSQLSLNAEDRDSAAQALDVLDRHHGLPIGMFSADEHFAGRSPSQGVELCAVVETMFSLEQAFAVSGDPLLADRIERIAYNALPATFTDDMWAHQYDQQPNQIKCSHGEGPWTTNGPESNLFGLEPHFGCCTANFHQGWPKLANSLFMATHEGGLAAVVYAPATVETVVRGVSLRLTSTTDYPFRDNVALTLDPARPVKFPLTLRVPGWASGARIRVNGRAVPAQPRAGFTTIDRRWRKGDRVDIAFEIETRTVPGFNNAVSVAHGALLYALPIEERWSRLKQRGLTADWEVFPASPWNHGIVEGASLVRRDGEVGPVPFAKRTPGSTVTASVKRAPQWRAERNWAAPPPVGPLAVESGSERVTLIPYGAAKLRIVAFPLVRA